MCLMKYAHIIKYIIYNIVMINLKLLNHIRHIMTAIVLFKLNV